MRTYSIQFITDELTCHRSRINFRHSTIKTTRLIITFLLTAIYISLFAINGWKQFKGTFFFLTQWGFNLTWFYFLYNTFKFIDKEPTHSLNTFFHLIFTLELNITLMFWAFILPTQTRKIYMSDSLSISEGEYEYIMLVLHTIPLICVLIDFVINKIVMKNEKMYVLFIVLFCYAIVNFIGTYCLHYHIYDIIDYKSWATLYYMFLAVFVAWVFWYVPTLLQKTKYVRVDTGEEFLY